MKNTKKIAEVVVALVRLGKMKEATQILETATTTKEESEPAQKEALFGTGKPFSTFQLDAQEAFLRKAMRGMSKAAGSKRESLVINRDNSNGTVWIEYVGLDSENKRMRLSLMFLEVRTDRDYVKVNISVEGEGGYRSEEPIYPMNRLTPKVLVEKFAQYVR